MGGVSDADFARRHNKLCRSSRHRGQRPLPQDFLDKAPAKIVVNRSSGPWIDLPSSNLLTAQRMWRALGNLGHVALIAASKGGIEEKIDRLGEKVYTRVAHHKVSATLMVALEPGVS